jgi:hypothetical protein
MDVLQLTNVIWRREDLRPPTQIRGLSGAFDRLDRLLPMAQYTGLPAQSHWNSNTECALCRSSEVDLLSYYSNLSAQDVRDSCPGVCGIGGAGVSHLSLSKGGWQGPWAGADICLDMRIVEGVD